MSTFAFVVKIDNLNKSVIDLPKLFEAYINWRQLEAVARLLLNSSLIVS